jgi:hypothetical protein
MSVILQGCLRVAHCGGLHVEALNDIVKALNVIAKLMGHHIRWDTETVGCDPSLSSIPPGVQRTLVDALTEIRSWMQLPENLDEFVIIFFDDQRNLETWVSCLQDSAGGSFLPYYAYEGKSAV